MICASSRSAIVSRAPIAESCWPTRVPTSSRSNPRPGDPLRRFTASGAVPPDGGDSPLFAYLNAGKRSVTRLSDELLTGADIVVVTATRSAAAERGIDPRACWNRHLGHRRHDLRLRGDRSVGGATRDGVHPAGRLRADRVPGDPAGPPISVGGDLGEYQGGAWAADGALAVPRGRTAGAAGATSTRPCSRRSR